MGGGYCIRGGDYVAQTNSSGNETSLKQLFQSMIPGGPEIMEGTVIQTDPLKIQMTGDEKHIISERVSIIPWHLTDYKTRATIPDQSIEKAIITVHNVLRKGDKLHVLSLNNGKLYYVLDRVAGQEVT